MPTEFLYSDPDMLRNYGERILIFNMHDPSTREAFSTARENTNGYVLVSEPVSIDMIEGVFDLDKGTWENFYNPRCRLDKAEEYGVNDAEKMCQYYSRVYQQRSCSFDNLKPDLRESVISIGQHYMQNLRYPTGGTPRFVKADTPANVQRTKEVRKDVIIEIVDDVAEQVAQKKNIKAKAMPKPDPPDLPAKSDPAKLQARTKPPPARATEPSPPKAPPKGFESHASTDTTVKVKEEPKSSTDTTVKKAKAAPATDTTVKKESSNKITLTPRGTSSTPATSSATPIPPAGPPPVKVPKPPPYPPRKPERSAGQPHPTPPPAPIHREQPQRSKEQRYPTPPPAPKRDYPRSSDTTEEPLPRRRREIQQDDVEMRPTFT